ncbi:hypothetical protein NHQ30_011590 [Ciborinia camelliae]|nr:hypothetical protein NHQ30_011590 [Ciborinia camelliae]
MRLSAATLRSSIRPAPFIVESPDTNKNTLILLHGTSSHGVPFGEELLEQIPFDTFLPCTKLIFPSGSLRKTTVFGGKETNAWFDIADFADRTKGEEQQKEGLKSSVEYLGELIQDVVDNESHDEEFQVFVGGFSQGCAMSMILLLSGELDRLGISQKLGGVVGFSGWLPFAKQLGKVASSGNDWKEKRVLVQSWLRRELELPPSLPRDEMVPLEENMTIFLAHGTSDEKVRMEWGEDLKRVLEAVGYNVEWYQYEGLGHVIVPDELIDMTDFIKDESNETYKTIKRTVVTDPPTTSTLML